MTMLSLSTLRVRTSVNFKNENYFYYPTKSNFSLQCVFAICIAFFIDPCRGLVSNQELSFLNDLFLSTDGDAWSWRPEEVAGRIWPIGSFDEENCAEYHNASCDPCDGGWQGVECEYQPPLGPPPDCGGGPSRNVYIVTSSGVAEETLCVNSTVVRINLMEYDMSGSLPDTISDMTNLVHLNLSLNYIGGELTPALFRLQKLENISLEDNRLSGLFPSDLATASSLRMLNLLLNIISGPLPDELGSLSALEVFSIGNNMFSGEIPTSMGRLSSLKRLVLNFNYIWGTLPDCMANLTSLRFFSTLGNFHTGSIPASYMTMTQLEFLSLRLNILTGTIPDKIGSLTSLGHIALGSNSFYGTIPSQIASLSRLRNLGLSFNYLHGTLPSVLSKLNSLEIFHLEGNCLFGTIPFEFASLTALTSFRAGSNRFKEELPACLTFWPRIEFLSLDGNSFFGTIPASWGKLVSLKNLDVSDNFLNGTIPPALLNISPMQYLELHDNFITGSLPSNLSIAFPSLRYLNVGDNFITGSIPSDLWSVTCLEVIYLYTNYISGTLPDDISNLQELVYVNMGRNLLSGTIPESIGNLTNMYGLNLDQNRFSGSIPASISRLTAIQDLILSKNSLTGSLPPLSKMFRLTSVSVQKNALTGSLDGVFGPGQESLKVIDVADNAFTGTMPISLFYHPRLITLSASMNCFHGRIPDEICDMDLMPIISELVLDGLTSSRYCQRSFYTLGLLDANFLSNQITGTIPVCLFQRQYIEKLRASGNGIGGTLPPLLPGSRLADIALAWNNIEGTIPESYSDMKFKVLDLSMNKISGRCIEITIDVNDPNSTLKLANNRLSGNIPPSFLHLPNLRILDGNMFECSPDRHELPIHDPDYDEYSCGSNTVNVALAIWIASLTILSTLVAGLYFWRYVSISSDSRRSVLTAISSLLLWIRKLTGISDDAFMAMHPELPLLFPRVAYFHRIYCHMRRLVVVVTGVVVFVFLPVYIAIHFTASSSNTSWWTDIYSEQYVSANAGTFSVHRHCAFSCLFV
jgi:Leucine-rich repeat (LRR) protein